MSKKLNRFILLVSLIISQPTFAQNDNTNYRKTEDEQGRLVQITSKKNKSGKPPRKEMIDIYSPNAKADIKGKDGKVESQIKGQLFGTGKVKYDKNHNIPPAPLPSK